MRQTRLYRAFYFTFILATLFGVLIARGPVMGHAEEFWASDEGLEITGLILDETKTKPGRDFFDHFNSYWKEVKGVDYSITIQELPDTQRLSFLNIKVNGTTVYRQRLNPRPDIVEETAKHAVNQVNRYLQGKKITQQRLKEEFQY